MIKQGIKRIFSLFGLEVRKKIHAPLHDPVAYNIKENTDKFFSNKELVSRYEDEKRISFYKEAAKLIGEQVDMSKVRAMADVSAGTGKFLAEVIKKFPGKQAYGYELSDAALALCKENCPGTVLERRDVYEKLPASFDLIICMDTLEHLEFPEKAVRNLYTSLNSGGSLFFVVPNGRYDTFEGHIHYWSPESFRLFIGGLGFPVSHIHLWREYGEQALIIRKA